MSGVLAGRLGGASVPRLDRYRFTPFATDAGYQSSPVWSPDGKTLAYVAAVDGVLQVFTKALGSPCARRSRMRGSTASDPFWSPDGTRLYYGVARDAIATACGPFPPSAAILIS